MKLKIRRGHARDAEAIARMNAAAGWPEQGVNVDPAHIRAHGFGPQPLFETLIAELEGRVIGCALTYKGYDVRLLSPIMVLADLYVEPAHRRRGVARLLFSQVARRAREIGCRKLQITTGVDDSVAHAFYAAIGAKHRGSALFELSADAIEWLANEGA